jgi:hypothetical protein
VALRRWWAEAPGRVVVDDAADAYELRPAPDRLPGLLFGPVPEPKTVGNRLHLDFRPDDPAAEMAPLLALGARHAEIGQGEQPWPWVVLASPEDDEFPRARGAAPGLIAPLPYPRANRGDRTYDGCEPVRWSPRHRPAEPTLGVGDVWHRPPTQRGPSS